MRIRWRHGMKRLAIVAACAGGLLASVYVARAPEAAFTMTRECWAFHVSCDTTGIRLTREHASLVTATMNLVIDFDGTSGYANPRPETIIRDLSAVYGTGALPADKETLVRDWKKYYPGALRTLKLKTQQVLSTPGVRVEELDNPFRTVIISKAGWTKVRSWADAKSFGWGSWSSGRHFEVAPKWFTYPGFVIAGFVGGFLTIVIPGYALFWLFQLVAWLRSGFLP